MIASLVLQIKKRRLTVERHTLFSIVITEGQKSRFLTIRAGHKRQLSRQFDICNFETILARRSTAKYGVYLQQRPKNIYPYRTEGTPRHHKLRRLFPICITALWVLGSYTDRQLLQYTVQQTVQLYRQGKGVSIYDDGGAFCSLRIYILWQIHLKISKYF